MALDATLMGYVQRALDASKAAAGAEQAEREHENAMLRARSEKNVHNYKALIAIGQLDAWRQKQYLESGRTLDHYKSTRAFFKYVLETLKTEEIKLKVCLNNAIFFWTILLAFGPLELKDGTTIARGALDKANWTTKVVCSKFADPSTLDFVLNGGFADGFLTELCKQGHGVETLNKKAKAMLNGTTDAPAKAPAKKPRRRSKKAAPVPAETTEAAETTPPKAKAPARRPRRRGRRREDDDDEDDFAPPPKVKADDEIKTAVGEAAPTTLDLLVDNNKMLRRDLAARDEELATARAEIAAYKEQIKKKEADKKFVEEMTIKPLKKRLAAVRDKLAREMAKNKHLSAAVCPRTSPLCDATNA